jgi:hypothetical protein
MDTKDAAINDSAECEIIKHLATPAPYIAAAVFTLTFVVKSIDLGNLAGLVVAANERYSVGIADLEGEQQEECFDRVKAPINKVAWKRCGRVWVACGAH